MLGIGGAILLDKDIETCGDTARAVYELRLLSSLVDQVERLRISQCDIAGDGVAALESISESLKSISESLNALVMNGPGEGYGE